MGSLILSQAWEMSDWLCLTESYKTEQQFDYFNQQFKKMYSPFQVNEPL